MNASNHPASLSLFAGALLFAAMPIVHATEVTTDLSPNGPSCGSLGYTQLHDLKLASKAHEGIEAFVRYVHLTQPLQHWTVEEALSRAKAASKTPCGLAMGLTPMEEKVSPKTLVANPNQ